MAFEWSDNRGLWSVERSLEAGWARRYHWLSESVADFVDEPHAGIISAATAKPLNLIAHESASARQASVSLAAEKPWKNLAELKRLQRLELPQRHQVLLQDIHPDRIASTLTSAYEAQPQNFEGLLGTPNVGPKTIRALALLSEVIHGAEASFRDPARFSFAHGGKDGHPYPVDRQTYDQSIHVLKEAVQRAKIGDRDRIEAIKRLNHMVHPGAA